MLSPINDHSISPTTGLPAVEPATGLPAQIFTDVLSYLKAEDLIRACGVCRTWRQLGSQEVLLDKIDLKACFRGLVILDQEVWSKHFDLNESGLSFDAPLPLSKARESRFLKKFYKDCPEAIKGTTLLTLPKGLDPSVLNKMIECRRTAPQLLLGSTTKYTVQSTIIPPLEKSYTIAITSYNIPATYSEMFAEQQTVIRQLHCEIPDLLEMAACMALTHLNSSDRPDNKCFEDTNCRPRQMLQRSNPLSLDTRATLSIESHELRLYEGSYKSSILGARAMQKM